MADEDKPKRSAVKVGEILAKYKRLARDRGAKLKEVESERDELKSRPSAEDITKDRDRLAGEIRSGKHRKAFDKAAADAKVKPEALDDLWELTRLDTSADEPDAKAIASAVASAVKSRPYVVGDGAKAPLNPGPGSDRGARVQSGGLTVTRAQLSDPMWMSEHQAEFAEHSAKGTVLFEG